MATPLARRPRFLADVPDVPAPEPVRFAPVSGRPSPPLRESSPLEAVPEPNPGPGPASPAQAALPEVTGATATAAPPTAAASLPAPVASPPVELGEAHRAAMERISATLQTLRAQADRLAEQARGDALEIGFLIARKILDTELHQSPEALFSLARSAIRKAGASRRIAVHLHPEDAASIQEALGRVDAEELSVAHVEILPDTSLQRGDCLVDTDFGQVDGRLATRFAELRRAIDAASEEEHP